MQNVQKNLICAHKNKNKYNMFCVAAGKHKQTNYKIKIPLLGIF